MSTTRWFAVTTAVAIALSLATTPVMGAAAASRSYPHPHTPHESAAIEPFAAYQPQFYCRHTVEPGVKKFEKLVLKAYPKTHSDGDLRACDDGGTSEHKDGRAWDWGADHRTKAGRAAGKAMLRWLFATDSYGNKDAMFRRLGLMYIIWNHRMWGAWDQKWQPYPCSGVTLCHVDHMHFSFGWAGAYGKVSYWTHKVGRTMLAPLPYFGHVGHTRSLTISASGTRYAMWLLRGGDRYTVTGTGVWRRHGKAVADAGCVKSSGHWQPAGVTLGDQFENWSVQWVPTRDTGGGCNTKTHTYRLELAPAAASTLQAAAPSRAAGGTGTVTLKVRRTA